MARHPAAGRPGQPLPRWNRKRRGPARLWRDEGKWSRLPVVTARVEDSVRHEPSSLRLDGRLASQPFPAPRAATSAPRATAPRPYRRSPLSSNTAGPAPHFKPARRSQPPPRRGPGQQPPVSVRAAAGSCWASRNGNRIHTAGRLIFDHGGSQRGAREGACDGLAGQAAAVYIHLVIPVISLSGHRPP